MSHLRYLRSLPLGETNRNSLQHATGVKRLRNAARQALLKISMCEAVDGMITLTIWKYSVTSFVNDNLVDLPYIYIYIYIYIHSPVHFIGYTLLIPGWTPPFAFGTALILCGRDLLFYCCKHSSEILVNIDMIASRSCCRFVGCTSMMRISRSTTSQRCSIELRSGDCGGHLSKVNSLSCSRNQSEMIWVLWHGVLSCWK